MKYINPINTARLSIELTELDIDGAEKLCEIPAQYEQRTTTELLRRITHPIDRPGAVADPRMWSVNERMYVIACYMAAMQDETPDFKIGEGRLSDYLLGNTDFTPDVANIGFECDGKELVYSPLLGYQAEVIETLIVSGSYSKTAFSWWAGCMAACIRGADEELPPYVDDASYEKDLVERIAGVRKLSESQFVALFDEYMGVSQRAAHLVYAITNSHGVLASQVSDQPEGVPELAPARFPPHSVISSRAREIMGFL